MLARPTSALARSPQSHRPPWDRRSCARRWRLPVCASWGASDRLSFDTPPTVLTTEETVLTRYVFELHVRVDGSVAQLLVEGGVVKLGQFVERGPGWRQMFPLGNVRQPLIAGDLPRRRVSDTSPSIVTRSATRWGSMTYRAIHHRRRAGGRSRRSRPSRDGNGCRHRSSHRPEVPRRRPFVLPPLHGAGFSVRGGAGVTSFSGTPQTSQYAALMRPNSRSMSSVADGSATFNSFNASRARS